MFARLIAAEDEEQLVAMDLSVFQVDDDPEGGPAAYQELLRELRQKCDARLIATISKLHDQFGHPTTRTLSHELNIRKAPKEWQLCASVYVCFFLFPESEAGADSGGGAF